MRKSLTRVLLVSMMLVVAMMSVCGASAEELRLIHYQAPTILNPMLAVGNKDSEAARLILEPLAAWDPDGNAVPVLAAEVPTTENGGISEDLMTTTWHLKEGVKWSDGTDFTADDVIFTYEMAVNTEVGSTYYGSYSQIESIEAPDPYTAVIHWKSPMSEPLTAFVGLFGMVIQKAQFEDYNNASASEAPGNLAPIGTGPYKLVEFRPGDVVLYEKNPLYRDADSVAFDTVTFKGGGDSASAARSVLQTGDFDYAFSLSLEKKVLDDLIANGPKGHVESVQGAATERILFNHANPDPELGDQRSEPGTVHPFLSDKNVRKALTMAIDRGLMNEQIWGLGATATCSFVNGPSWAISENLAWGSCEQDMEGAKALLDEAGWVDSDGDGVREKDGVRLSVVYQTTVNSARQKMQEYIKSVWNELGVEVELKAIEAGVFFSTDAGNPDTSGKFYADIEQVNNGGSGGASVARYLQIWTCDEMCGEANKWNGRNSERYCNPEYDKLYEQLVAEGDVAKRGEIAKRMDEMLVEDGAAIPLHSRTTMAAVSNDLQGVNITPWDCEMWNVASWHK